MKGLLSKLVESHFPREHVKCAIGYGSAVFKQANYEQSNSEQVIDILLVVDDTSEFHRKNMSGDNYKHYSYWAKRLPLIVTNQLVQNRGSRMYFNPLIPLNSFPGVTSQDDLRRIKYGTISEENAVQDLQEWTQFGLAGRLQKPVLPFISDSDAVKEAMDKNIDNALNLAIFTHYKD